MYLVVLLLEYHGVNWLKIRKWRLTPARRTGRHHRHRNQDLVLWIYENERHEPRRKPSASLGTSSTSPLQVAAVGSTPSERAWHLCPCPDCAKPWPIQQRNLGFPCYYEAMNSPVFAVPCERNFLPRPTFQAVLLFGQCGEGYRQCQDVQGPIPVFGSPMLGKEVPLLRSVGRVA